MSFAINAIAILSTICTIVIIGTAFRAFCIATGRERRDNSEDLNDFDIALVRGMITLTIIVALYLLALLIMSCCTTISFGKYFMRFLLAIIEMFLLIYINSRGTRDNAMAALAIKIAKLLIVACVLIVLISSIQLSTIDFFISIIFLIAATLIDPEIFSTFVLLVFETIYSIRNKIRKQKEGDGKL